MANAALNVRTYICQCEREACAPIQDGAWPSGWQYRNGVFICDDCVAFENLLSATECRTHDNTSAINDDAPPAVAAAPFVRPIMPGRNLWQITFSFGTDMGAVEADVIVAAADLVEVTEMIPSMIDRSKRRDLVSINITPPHMLPIRGPAK